MTWRASSCRNVMVCPSCTSRPPSTHASTARSGSSNAAASITVSAPSGSSAIASSSSRASGVSCAARARTVSCTDVRSPGAAASSSVTTKGTPPLRRWTSAGSHSVEAARAATALVLSGSSRRRRRALIVGEIAERRAQRVIAAQIVAVGCDHDASRAVDAAARERKEVERRGVGPLQVFEHGQRRWAVVRARDEELGEQTMSVVAVGELREVAARGTGDVEHRTERSRGLQWITLTPQHPRDRPLPRAQLLGERGLADAGFARDHDEATLASACGHDTLVERRKLRLPLEEPHG